MFCLARLSRTSLRKTCRQRRGVRTTRLHRPQAAPSSCMPLTAHGEQSALRSHRTPNAAASTASHPASLTIRIRPSVGRDAKVLDLIWVRWQQIFFGKSEKNDSTTLSANRPTGKSPPMKPAAPARGLSKGHGKTCAATPRQAVRTKHRKLPRTDTSSVDQPDPISPRRDVEAAGLTEVE